MCSCCAYFTSKENIWGNIKLQIQILDNTQTNLIFPCPLSVHTKLWEEQLFHQLCAVLFSLFCMLFFFFFSYMLSKFWSKSRADFLIFSRLARCSPWEYLNVPNTVLCFETLLTPERTDYHSLKTISFLLEIHWLIITYSPMAEEASRDWRLLTTGCWTLFFFFPKSSHWL